MADYRLADARFTAIFVRAGHDPGDKELWIRVPFELVRFNVDVNPSVEPVIVPIGETYFSTTGVKPDSPKIYEKVWFVDQVPFAASRGGKHMFGGVTP